MLAKITCLRAKSFSGHLVAHKLQNISAYYSMHAPWPKPKHLNPQSIAAVADVRTGVDEKTDLYASHFRLAPSASEAAHFYFCRKQLNCDHRTCCYARSALWIANSRPNDFYVCSSEPIPTSPSGETLPYISCSTRRYYIIHGRIYLQSLVCRSFELVIRYRGNYGQYPNSGLLV